MDIDPSKEPEFKPRPGQVDFTHARYCPTLNCVVRHNGKILIVKRPDRMRLYPGAWGGITGFLDDEKTLEEKIKEELSEEIGIGPESVIAMRFGEAREIEDAPGGKVWIAHPALVDVDTNKLNPNWEVAELRWIYHEEMNGFQFTPGFPEIAHNLLKDLP